MPTPVLTAVISCVGSRCATVCSIDDRETIACGDLQVKWHYMISPEVRRELQDAESRDEESVANIPENHAMHGDDEDRRMEF